MAEDLDAKLEAEFGKSGLRYVDLYSQNHLRRAFEIIDDVDGAREGLEDAASKGQLDKQAKKKYPRDYLFGGASDPAVIKYVEDQVREVSEMAHAKADVIFSYLYNAHANRDHEDVHGGGGTA